MGVPLVEVEGVADMGRVFVVPERDHGEFRQRRLPVDISAAG